MKKVIICLLFLGLLFLAGCEKEEPYYYREFHGRQFIYQSSGVYKNGEDYIYWNKSNNTITITNSFDEVKVIIEEKRNPKVIFPDGCIFYVNDSYSLGINTTHNHDSASYAALKDLKFDNTAEIKERNLMLLIDFSLCFLVGIVALIKIMKKNPKNTQRYEFKEE